MISNRTTSNKYFYRRGTTLIELMIVTAIILILSVLVSASYHQGRNRVLVDTQANQFAQDLRRVQEWAMAAHQISGQTKYGYGIYLTQGSNSYIIYLDDGNAGGAIIPGNGRYDIGFDTVQETIALEKNVEVSLCVPNPASINYMVPNPSTKIGGNDLITQQQIEFRAKGTSTVRRVVANKAGLVYVQ